MKLLPCCLLPLLASVVVCAQTNPVTGSTDGFYARYSNRTTAIQSRQPGWAVPLVTTYTGLFQVLRTDMVRQITPARTNTWNLDNSKGINFIPWNNTEFAINLPPYVLHNSTTKDGAGDMSFLGKYRIASRNERQGHYTISAFLIATIPTGSYKNGSTDATLTPSLGVGKGFGRFDVQTTAGGTFATGKPASTIAGKPIGWNVAAQYHIAKFFWPEIESNATFYKGGTNDGKTQEFITPGMIVGKCKLRPEDARSRPGLAFGAGMQIATSHVHSYNHALILTGRWIF